MLELFAAQSPIDPMLIGEVLRRDGHLDGIGGVNSVANLSLGLPYIADLSKHVELVRRKALQREAIRVCQTLVTEMWDDDAPATELLENAQTRINDLCVSAISGHDTGHFRPIKAVLEAEVFAALEDLRYGRVQKIHTGFPAIDAAIGGGISRSDVLLVAADTGRGKSALALQMAFNMAKGGFPTAFLAGEMTDKENILRLLSQLSGVTNLNWLTHTTRS